MRCFGHAQWRLIIVQIRISDMILVNEALRTRSRLKGTQIEATKNTLAIN